MNDLKQIHKDQVNAVVREYRLAHEAGNRLLQGRIRVANPDLVEKFNQIDRKVVTYETLTEEHDQE